MPRPQGITSSSTGVFLLAGFICRFQKIPILKTAKRNCRKLKMTEKVKEAWTEPAFPSAKYTLFIKQYGCHSHKLSNPSSPLPLSPLLLHCTGESQNIESLRHTKRLTTYTTYIHHTGWIYDQLLLLERWNKMEKMPLWWWGYVKTQANDQGGDIVIRLILLLSFMPVPKKKYFWITEDGNWIPLLSLQK